MFKDPLLERKKYIEENSILKKFLDVLKTLSSTLDSKALTPPRVFQNYFGKDPSSYWRNHDFFGKISGHIHPVAGIISLSTIGVLTLLGLLKYKMKHFTTSVEEVFKEVNRDNFYRINNLDINYKDLLIELDCQKKLKEKLRYKLYCHLNLNELDNKLNRELRNNNQNSIIKEENIYVDLIKSYLKNLAVNIDNQEDFQILYKRFIKDGFAPEKVFNNIVNYLKESHYVLYNFLDNDVNETQYSDLLYIKKRYFPHYDGENFDKLVKHSVWNEPSPSPIEQRTFSYFFHKLINDEDHNHIDTEPITLTALLSQIIQERINKDNLNHEAEFEFKIVDNHFLSRLFGKNDDISSYIFKYKKRSSLRFFYKENISKILSNEFYCYKNYYIEDFLVNYLSEGFKGICNTKDLIKKLKELIGEKINKYKINYNIDKKLLNNQKYNKNKIDYLKIIELLKQIYDINLNNKDYEKCEKLKILLTIIPAYCKDEDEGYVLDFSRNLLEVREDAIKKFNSLRQKSFFSAFKNFYNLLNLISFRFWLAYGPVDIWLNESNTTEWPITTQLGVLIGGFSEALLEKSGDFINRIKYRAKEKDLFNTQVAEASKFYPISLQYKNHIMLHLGSELRKKARDSKGINLNVQQKTKISTFIDEIKKNVDIILSAKYLSVPHIKNHFIEKPLAIEKQINLLVSECDSILGTKRFIKGKARYNTVKAFKVAIGFSFIFWVAGVFLSAIGTVAHSSFLIAAGAIVLSNPFLLGAVAVGAIVGVYFAYAQYKKHQQRDQQLLYDFNEKHHQFEELKRLEQQNFLLEKLLEEYGISPRILHTGDDLQMRYVQSYSKKNLHKQYFYYLSFSIDSIGTGILISRLTVQTAFTFGLALAAMSMPFWGWVGLLVFGGILGVGWLALNIYHLRQNERLEAATNTMADIDSRIQIEKDNQNYMLKILGCSKDDHHAEEIVSQPVQQSAVESQQAARNVGVNPVEFFSEPRAHLEEITEQQESAKSIQKEHFSHQTTFFPPHHSDPIKRKSQVAESHSDDRPGFVKPF